MKWGSKRHKHIWVRGGYGGCGWFVFRCATCGEVEIG